MITDKDQELLAKMSPVVDGTTFDLPFPTSHPDIRMSRRLNFRNEMTLYRRNCSFTNTPIVSVYSQDKDYVVYNQSAWWSDDWDRFSYGFELDESR